VVSWKASAPNDSGIMNAIDLSTAASVYFGGSQLNTVSGASPSVPPSPSTTDPAIAQMRSDLKQNSQDFKDLKSTLSSNDLASATQAFTAVQQDIQNASQATGGKSPFDPNNPIGKDFQAIGDALKSGNLSAAKQAFANFKHDIKAAGKSAHGHHHHVQLAGANDNGSSSMATDTNATTASQTAGSALNTTA
jgi:hypothetical protein